MMVHVLVFCRGGSKPRTVLQFASGFAAGQKTPARVYMEKIFRFDVYGISGNGISFLARQK